MGMVYRRQGCRPSLSWKILYIFTIYNYNENKFSQRIYKINTYDLNNYKFTNTIRISIYKNFLSLCSNFHIGGDGSILSSIIIFSYPNSTNINVNLINYLLENNDITINNLVFELKNECYMENNIFGYIYTGIQIIENCNEEKDIYLTSLSDEKIELSFPILKFEHKDKKFLYIEIRIVFTNL